MGSEARGTAFRVIRADFSGLADLAGLVSTHRSVTGLRPVFVQCIVKSNVAVNIARLVIHEMSSFGAAGNSAANILPYKNPEIGKGNGNLNEVL